MRPTCWKVKVKKGTKLWTIWRNVWKGYQEKRFIRDGYLEMYRISVQVNLERYLTFFVQMLKRAPRKTGLFFFWEDFTFSDLQWFFSGGKDVKVRTLRALAFKCERSFFSPKLNENFWGYWGLNIRVHMYMCMLNQLFESYGWNGETKIKDVKTKNN